MTDWVPPPGNTIWVLDRHDRNTNELLATVDVSDAHAAAVTDLVAEHAGIGQRAELHAHPHEVTELLAGRLRDILGTDLDLEAYRYYLTVFQSPSPAQ
jgi:hypothetical protein